MRPFILLLALIFFFDCSNDDSENISINLQTLGITGEWEVTARGVDLVSSLEVPCCETITFEDDTNQFDLRGTYVYDFGTITNGVFSINLIDSTILFTTENNNSESLYFNLDSNELEVWSFEDGIREWTIYSKN